MLEATDSFDWEAELPRIQTRRWWTQWVAWVEWAEWGWEWVASCLALAWVRWVAWEWWWMAVPMQLWPSQLHDLRSWAVIWPTAYCSDLVTLAYLATTWPTFGASVAAWLAFLFYSRIIRRFWIHGALFSAFGPNRHYTETLKWPWHLRNVDDSGRLRKNPVNQKQILADAGTICNPK